MSVSGLSQFLTVDPQGWISSAADCTSANRPSRSLNADQRFVARRLGILDEHGLSTDSAPSRVFLEEFGPLIPFGAAQQRERAAEQ